MGHPMQAVEISEFGEANVLRLCERARPTQKSGEVLIRVHAAGLNRADLLQRKGFYPPPEGASEIPGLEISGTVEAVGSACKRIKPGDDVVALLEGGGYAEYVAVAEQQVLPKPTVLSMVDAAGLPECCFTVWSNIFDRGYLKEGETVLVHGGMSGIGTTAIQMAKGFGASVFVTCGNDAKCAAARNLGADLAINYNTDDFVAEVTAATQNKGVDVVLDMVGGSYLERELQCMATGARLVVIAFLGGVRGEVDLASIMRKRQTITGSTLRGRSANFKGAIAAQLEYLVWPLIEEGKISPVIDSTFALKDAAAAHKRMESGEHMGKIILTMTD